MQSINRFTENYVEPVIYHPVSQFAFKLVTEVVKIIAAKIFLEYLGNCYLKNPAKISKNEVYETIIEAPIIEEIFFRLVVLQSIHLAQIALNYFEKDRNEDENESDEDQSVEPRFRIHLHSFLLPSSSSQNQSANTFVISICLPMPEELIYQGVKLGIEFWQKYKSIVRVQLASTIFGPSDQNPQSDNFVITMYPPLMEEMFFGGYVHSIYWITKIAKYIFDRMYLASGLFANELEQTDSFVIPINLPLEQEVICRGIMKGISWINIPSDGIQDESTEEDKKGKLQQIFRIHFAALIFAAAHLSNPHQTKTGTLMQFVWTYIGGVIYGYLSEKYCSLAPGVLAHGFNNTLATAGRIYPKVAPFLIVALFVNRIATYLLAMTSIDRIILRRNEV